MIRYDGDKFLHVLCFALLGYALMGRGFAYVGFPPLFIGEIVLVSGLFVLAWGTMIRRVLDEWRTWPLIGLVGWGLFRAVPYIRPYGIEALRDVAILAYALYAIVVFAVLIEKPSRLMTLVERFRQFIPIFLVLAPFAWLLTMLADDGITPRWPWVDKPIVHVKGGDAAVHVAGVFAFVSAMPGVVITWMMVFLTPLNLVLQLFGRAAAVTFGLCAVILATIRPRARFPRMIAAVLVLAVILLLVTGLEFSYGDGARSLSFRQLSQNIESIFTESESENLAGSKNWRLNWWSDIVDYTIHGRYFWTGKGFGVNLADDDGYQVNEDGSLRSPHNGHLTVLARAGVPGLALWLCVLAIWGVGMLRRYVRAHKAGDEWWSGLLLFLMMYLMAFLINATFDVFLEGPMGGIWFWSVYGVGWAAMWIYDRCPEAVTTIEDSADSQLLPAAGR